MLSSARGVAISSIVFDVSSKIVHGNVLHNTDLDVYHRKEEIYIKSIGSRSIIRCV